MIFYGNIGSPDGDDDEFDEEKIFEKAEASATASAFGEFASEVLDLTRKVFRTNGWLRSRLRMENRPQQTRMAESVAETFVDGASLLFEAGTGVGKSLAYLVPGLIYAKLSRKKFVVSTNTILLQEQILKKDLAICRDLFSGVPELHDFAGFKVVLMIGKANYLCGTRLAESLRRREGIFDGSDGSAAAQELKMIRDWWAEEGCTGIREHLPRRVSDDVWESVNADSRACSRKNCTPQTCAYRRARAELERADLVVVNHSLLFSMIDAGAVPQGDAPGVLYANDFVVLDEAHRVPDVATDYFGVETSSYAVQHLLTRILNACRKSGVLAKHGKAELEGLVAEAKDAADVFFNQIRFGFLDKGRQTVRFREPDWLQNVCEIPLGNLENRLKAIAQIEERPTTKDEINDFADDLQEHRLAIRECLELKRAPKYVYWAELGQGARRIVKVSGAPIDVAPQLADALFGRGTSAVLSSATLSDNRGNMSRFRNCCGAGLAGDSVRMGREESPFDYAKNMEIFVSEDCPEQDKHEELGKNVEYNAAVVAHCAKMMPAGGILVLCTSFDFCSKFAKELRKLLSDEREILVQGEGMMRPELTRRFTHGGNAILIGNHSFWTGIDVPGVALSQVVVPRLPFANPAIPIVEARMEWIKERGGNPFFEMSLPDAVLQFRQGIGRLIRKTTDRGRLILTDSRLLKKAYGKQFLSALPHQKYVRFTRDLLETCIGPWEAR
ncbi:MAG: ATP-dependent DNA helicase [Opitutae bacterium]|nr:ATP-dependent DNA helicase [Opitutae bacterium]